jgi:oxygen-dependent protoporphyrinogen oxidase
MTRVAVVGGGIAGLAAARRLEAVAGVEVVLVEASERLGGKLLTEHADGFVVEGAPDSFLTRKARGAGLCDELGLGPELIGRRPENARSFVRRGDELHPLPEGLTGMIPTNLDALASSTLLSEEGKARAAREAEVPPAPPGDDESLASFVSRRLGREAYETLVEPLLTGIYGGDGDQLSLQATFPNLRALELEHGSLLRGLLAQSPGVEPARPPFLSLRRGMETLVDAIAEDLERTLVLTGRTAERLDRTASGYGVVLEDGELLAADGVVVAVPAFVAAELFRELDAGLAEAHAAIPYASTAVVTFGHREEDVPNALDGYGYVVPRSEGSEVLACTWTSSKWEGRAPEGFVLIRVFAGRYGERDVTALADEELLRLARVELGVVGIEAEPTLTRVHRWPRGMPQYVLGHPERLERIDAAVAGHPGLALAGAAYRGVGIPDCIRSGEEAAEAVVSALARVPG